MTLTPVTGGLALPRCGGRGECQRLALESYPWLNKQANNQLLCVWAPDRCYSLGFSCSLPGSSGDLRQLVALRTHTRVHTHLHTQQFASVASDSPDL